MTVLPCPPSFRLDGKRALVVGASSGIGLGCAVVLADAGARVTLAGRRKADLLAAQTALAGKGWETDVLTVDVADVRTFQGVIADVPHSKYW